MDPEDARARILEAFDAALAAQQDGDTYQRARQRLWNEFVERGLADVEEISEFCDEIAEAVHARWPIWFSNEP